MTIDSKVYAGDVILPNCNVNKAKKQQTEVSNIRKESSLKAWEVSSLPGILLLFGYPALFLNLFSDGFHKRQRKLIIILIKLVVPVCILVHT